MDPSEFPFDIEAYKKQSEIEERYIVNRFKERRKKLLKNKHLAARGNTSKEIMLLQMNGLLMITLRINQHMMMQYFVGDSGCENMFFFGSLETYQAMTTTSPSELMQPIKKVYLHWQNVLLPCEC